MQFWQCVSTAGFFTAPVKGVHHFGYTGGAFLKTKWVNEMYHNNKFVQNIASYSAAEKYRTVSVGATLQLEVGDVVNLRTSPGQVTYCSLQKCIVCSE